MKHEAKENVIKSETNSLLKNKKGSKGSKNWFGENGEDMEGTHESPTNAKIAKLDMEALYSELAEI